MATDEEQIRTLIERWAEAVHGGDIDRVVADHAGDIVVFDVPPPYEGVRGIDAYRDIWPPFFEWQAQGASFAIESLEVTVGGDVAFACALLRCGTPGQFVRDPALRLRLTLGLCKEHGRWLVAHEHHSFPATGAAPVADEAGDEAGDEAYDEADDAAEQEIRRLHRRWFDDTAAKDLDAMMAAIADDVVSYEHEEPLQHLGVQSVRAVCERNLDASGDATVTWDVPDLTVIARDDLAVAWGLNHVRVEHGGAETFDGWSRGTRVFRRVNGTWAMVHQHLSVPFDPATGEARTALRP